MQPSFSIPFCTIKRSFHARSTVPASAALAFSASCRRRISAASATAAASDSGTTITPSASATMISPGQTTTPPQKIGTLISPVALFIRATGRCTGAVNRKLPAPHCSHIADGTIDNNPFSAAAGKIPQHNLPPSGREQNRRLEKQPAHPHSRKGQTQHESKDCHRHSF